eukprot:TRINITY_DN7974_c0_g4_i2.p1 TRINITY_DN7974_c0_g4~~TRINITY_DN7974_c0_g4_i2.p1  ORF type:complete len:129 (-),score=35.45 TRINITY_DN7974_c0_g4_i2:315-701(-)
MDKLQEKFKRALKNEIEAKHKRFESLNRGVSRYRQYKEKIKQLHKAQLSMQMEMKQRQTEDMKEKERRKVQAEKATLERYKKLSRSYMEKMQNIKKSRILEDERNERKQKELLTKIEQGGKNGFVMYS